MVGPVQDTGSACCQVGQHRCGQPGSERRSASGRIMEGAKGLGADAVILGKVDILESLGSRTLYESTVNPPGTGYVFVCGGGLEMAGSLSCVHADSWSHVQRAADQRK